MSERDIVVARLGDRLERYRTLFRDALAYLAVSQKEIYAARVGGLGVFERAVLELGSGERVAVDRRILFREVEAGELVGVEDMYVRRELGAAVEALRGVGIVISGLDYHLAVGDRRELALQQSDGILGRKVRLEQIARDQQKIYLVQPCVERQRRERGAELVSAHLSASQIERRQRTVEMKIRTVQEFYHFRNSGFDMIVCPIKRAYNIIPYPTDYFKAYPEN